MQLLFLDDSLFRFGLYVWLQPAQKQAKVDLGIFNVEVSLMPSGFEQSGVSGIKRTRFGYRTIVVIYKYISIDLYLVLKLRVQTLENELRTRG